MIEDASRHNKSYKKLAPVKPKKWSSLCALTQAGGAGRQGHSGGGGWRQGWREIGRMSASLAKKGLLISEGIDGG